MPGWRWHLALIAFLACAGYGQLLLPGHTLYSPHSDFVAWGLANKQVLFRSMQAGDGLAFWRADQLAGYAALSNPNSLYTYPLHAPFAFLPPQVAVGPVTWLHFVLSALGFYVLGAVLGLSGPARLLMACAGLFSFKLILATYAGFLFMPAAALVAAQFAAFVHAWRTPSPTAWLLFSLATYLCLNGHPQIELYALVACGAWSLVWFVARVREGQTELACRSLFVLATGVVVALAMLAHVLLPLADERALVTRGERDYAAHLAGHSVGASHLATLVFPEALGTPLDHSYPTDELWEDAMYFGLVPLLLALCAVVLCRRRPIVLGLALSLGVVLFLACDTPVLRLIFDHVPGASYLRHPGRVLFLAPLFGIALAGFGLEALLARVRSPRHAAALVTLVLALIGGEGLYYARRYVTTLPAEQAFPTPPFTEQLRSDASTFRVAPLGRPVLNYGWAAPLGLQLVAGYDHINYVHYQAFMDTLRRGEPGPTRAAGWYDLSSVARYDLLDALNVKYLVAQQPLQPLPAQLREVGRWPASPAFYFFYGIQERPAILYENLHARQRAYFVDSVTPVDEKTVLAALSRSDLSRVALVHDSAHGAGTTLAQLGNARVDDVRSRDGRLELTTTTDAARLLVISEIWHPGWRARLDGAPLPLLRANVALMGAWLPPGQHRVELELEPPSWALGVGISALAAIAWLLVLLGRNRLAAPH